MTPCSYVKLPDGSVAIVKHGCRGLPPCSVCGGRAGKLCDFPTPKGSCDAPLCGSCARRVAPNVDHCPSHPIAQQALALGGA